jgi:hypothetical protein
MRNGVCGLPRPLASILTRATALLLTLSRAADTLQHVVRNGVCGRSYQFPSYKIQEESSCSDARSRSSMTGRLLVADHTDRNRKPGSYGSLESQKFVSNLTSGAF